MILKMSLVTGLYIAFTALLWLTWRRRRHTLFFKILIGIIYGLCSILSTHVGIDYSTMVLNVRDLGPLAAGLFFSPVSGLISGFIGGIERYIAGTYWDVGSFTTMACSISTCLAGIISALLGRYVYKNKKPFIIHAFFIGAVMEVFHMYAVFLFGREYMRVSYFVVSTCAPPMILFTGIGLALCTIVIKLLTGELTRASLRLSKKEDTSVETRFQRTLFVCISIVFIFNYYASYNMQTLLSKQDATTALIHSLDSIKGVYDHMGDDPQFAEDIQRLEYLASGIFILILDEDRYDHSENMSSDSKKGLWRISEKDYELLKSHVNKLPFQANLSFYNVDRDYICAATTLPDNRILVSYMYLENVYNDRNNQMYETTLADILLFTAVYLIISILVNKLVIRDLRSVNESLERISNGELDEVVNARSSAEFSALSDDLNRTVDILKGYIGAAEKRIEQDLELAATIQDSALPHVFTFNRKDFEIYAMMSPAKHVGGDFYDFFFTEANKVALVIADVSGKGIPASLFMMRSKTTIQTLARRGHSPKKIFFEANNLLCEGNLAEMFVTAWIGIIDLTTGLMQCANAGHEYPILMRRGEAYELMRDPHAPALATMEDLPMKEYELQLNPGDRIFVYTDGVPEAINEREEQYGTGRLVEKLNMLKDISEEETLKAVRGDIQEFVGKADQFDDITMLGFTYVGKQKKS